jgi:hypothetical protein
MTTRFSGISDAECSGFDDNTGYTAAFMGIFAAYHAIIYYFNSTFALQHR